MFAKKALKSEKESKALCNIMFPHDIDYPTDHLTNLFRHQHTITCSIDPGTKNYAIRIADRDNVARKSITIYYNKWELDPPLATDDPDVSIDRTYTSLSNKLISITDLLEQVDVLIVERQLPINYNSTRVMQHTVACFEHVFRQNKTGRYPIICLVAPQLKGKMLGAPRGLPKPELKKWSVEVTFDILETNEDEWALSKIEAERKKDDLADVVTQYEAFCLYFEIDKLVVKPIKMIKEESKRVKHIQVKNKDGSKRNIIKTNPKASTTSD
jgi:hypothetical protein